MTVVHRVKFLLAIESILPLILVRALLRLSTGLWSPLLNVYFAAIGIPIALIGLLNSVKTLIESGVLLSFGSLSDKIGRRKPILAAVLLHLAAICLLILTKNVGVVFLSLALEGLALGIRQPAVTGYVADLVTGARSGMAFSSMFFFSIIAGVVSTIVGAFIAEKYGFLRDFQTAAVVILVTFLLTYVFVKESLEGRLNGVRGSLKTTLGDAGPMILKTLRDDRMRLLILGVMIHSFASRLANTYLSLYATTVHGFDLITIGWLLGLRQIGDFIGQLPSGKIIERLGGEIPLFVHVLGTAPTAFIFATSRNLTIIAIVMIIWGTELGWDQPSRRMLSVKYMGSSGRAAAAAAVQSLSTFASIVAPLLGGVLWSLSGPTSVFIVITLLNVGGAVPLFFLTYREYRRQDDSHSVIIPEESS